MIFDGIEGENKVKVLTDKGVEVKFQIVMVKN